MRLTRWHIVNKIYTHKQGDAVSKVGGRAGRGSSHHCQPAMGECDNMVHSSRHEGDARTITGNDVRTKCVTRDIRPIKGKPPLS